MLTVSQKQVDALAVSQAGTIIRWHIERLHERFPGLYVNELHRFHPLVVDGRDQAIALDITREDDIAIFLDLSVMYGRTFASEPWARTILQKKTVHGHDRMALLRHTLKQRGVVL